MWSPSGTFHTWPVLATLLALAAALRHHSAAAATASLASDPEAAPARGRVLFVAATVPWFFGAYQEQALALSTGFAARGYDALWMPRTRNTRLPPGEHADWRAAMARMTATRVRPPTKAEQARMRHLTFVGVPEVDVPAAADVNPEGLSVRELNAAARLYGLDAIVLLMDIGMLYLDEHHCDVPTVLWLPYHFETLNYQRPVVAAVSAVAALSATAARVLAEAQPLTHAIPHSIDRARLTALATAAEKAAARGAGGALRPALFNSTRYDRMFRRDIDAVTADTFLVLMQGGNYEPADRKGWVASIDAFARFQRAHPARRVHLWIHSVDSTMVARDYHHGESTLQAPRHGISLRLTLQRAGIPSNMYTLDENYHNAGLTMALKKNADVCLHTSKSEGFGMVVLECQALGTPVVTTNYTAMRDYTKYGVAVEPAGLEPFQGGYFALPSVPGTAAALAAVAAGAVEYPPLEDVFAWIDADLALGKIVADFEALIGEAARAPRRPWTAADAHRARPAFTVVTDETPAAADWDTPWTLYHRPGTRVDRAGTQRALLRAAAAAPVGIALIAPTRGGMPVAVMGAGGSPHMLSRDVVVLVPTWILRQFQEQKSNVWDIIYGITRALGSEKYMAQLPSSLAQLPDEGEGASAGRQMREL